MTSHEQIIERMDRANPLPDVEMITDGQLAELGLRIEEARRTEEVPVKTEELVSAKSRIRWLRPAVAFGAATLLAFAVIGAVSLLTGDETKVADQSPTSVVETTTTISPTSDAWDPLLATAVAGPVPEPAGCPSDTDPTAPGPADQKRPMLREDDHDGAFDRHLGKMIYVDVARQTWSFDVCTNTWEQLDTAGQPVDASLVYDTDSDVTLSLGAGDFSVYDAAANEWTRPSAVVAGGPRPGAYLGVTYDPVSGLVITTAEDGIWAIDVAASTLTRIGTVPEESQLAGYAATLDRLVFVGSETVLVDPRTGDRTTAAAPPFGPSEMSGFFEAAGTVFLTVTVDDRFAVCGFDQASLTWSRCYDATPPDIEDFASKVEDPINGRVILTRSTPTVHDVWALELDDGSLTEIVAPGVPSFAAMQDPVLATATALPTPEPAGCPAGTDPNVPGPSDQLRPTTVEDDHDGTFDRRTGRVIYVDTMQRTWAFDVCTNTWQDLQPAGIPIDESLVYDVDSDVTIALGPGTFSVYDAKTNEWTRPSIEVVGAPPPPDFSGVVYDPVSGLVITTSRDQIWGFDVETNRLTYIGVVPGGGQLAGYAADIDRLVFVATPATVLVDPRTGEATMPSTGEVPFAGWGWYDFFDAAGSVFIGATVDGPGEACGFNPRTLAWDYCYEGLSPRIESFASRVEDSINGRVILLDHRNTIGAEGDDVWALDLASGEMTELLAPDVAPEE